MRIKLLAEQYKPEYKTSGSSGADLHARGDWNIQPSKTIKIPLGVCFEIPVGYEVQIRPRSGLSAKGIYCAFGTVDCDYRGEVSVVVTNNSKKMFSVHDGDRICQMVYAPVTQVDFDTVDELSDTERGTNGFGSTGVN
jgi:dUTP pyrophosphatase